jgi:dienelactone hydrolase
MALLVVLMISLALAWLRWNSSEPREEWFSERQGEIVAADVEQSVTVFGQVSEAVELRSDSGLHVSFRVIRNSNSDESLPVFLVLGGHRTGSDAVEIFGEVRNHAVVGLDYPYDGPEKADGIVEIAKMIPLARRAILDTVPAVSLVLDWLNEQTWVDQNRIVVIGASLGVPFAANAAARDKRIHGVVLVHGAADNRLWLEIQIARRIDTEMLHGPLATVVYWLAYGPILDTSESVSAISPRPVLIIGARDDERTPVGQVELLFESANEPKRLRWTDGQHIQTSRTEIVAELLRIADEELPFLTQ